MENKNPFKSTFISGFTYVPESFNIKDEDILKLDTELNQFEEIFLDSEIEKNLISRNELLASFAISKAENSELTLEEAHDVYQLVLENKEFDFIHKKIGEGKSLDRKDYEKLEFFNIARTFRTLNKEAVRIENITPEFIRKIHFEITKGLDIFSKILPEFTVYKSGSWRDNNQIRVGEYVPAGYADIPDIVSELTEWLAKNFSITHIALFHNALYAVHPFNNGNKRVCRVLEHILIRQVGLNKKNLYSTSYYYHKEKSRYYKRLTTSLARKNLSIFSTFILDSIILSILGVVKTSLESRRLDFILHSDLEKDVKKILKPLVKKHELQFKNFYRIIRKKVSKQTFVNYLALATTRQILLKRTVGKTTYYGLNIRVEEQDFLDKWLDILKDKTSVVSDLSSS